MTIVSKPAVTLFRVILLAFAIAFMIFWNTRITNSGEEGSNVWVQRMAFLLVIISSYIWIFSSNIRTHGIHLICLLWVLIMPIMIFLNRTSLSYIPLLVLWPLLFEATYLICYHNLKDSFALRKTIIVIAYIGAYLFLMTRLDIESQTNTIYFCFLTLPWLLYCKGQLKRMVLLALFSVFAVLSLKRGMMLTVVLIWMFYYIERIKNKRNLLYVVIGFLSLLILVSLSYDRVDEALGGKLTERVTREETDSGHDRMAIWEMTTYMIQQSSAEKLVFGHGHGGVRSDSFIGLSAHNDFLEIIYDYGLIVFALYLCLWAYILRRGYYLFKVKSSLFFPYMVSLSIMLVMSMISELLPYCSYFNYLVMFWGMTEASVEIEKRNTAIQKRLSK